MERGARCFAPRTIRYNRYHHEIDRFASARRPLSVPGFAEGIPDHDRRNTSIRHTDTHYEFGDYKTLDEWKQRAQHLQRQVRFSAGLMPLPAKTPLHAEVFGKTEHEDYTIEKVILETYPGFFLGGNLFRPVGKSGPFRPWFRLTAIGVSDAWKTSNSIPPSAAASPWRGRAILSQLRHGGL